MKRATRFLPVIFIFCTISAYGFEKPEFNVHLEIKSIESSRGPYFIADNLILTYQEDHPLRFVGAVFEHEMDREIMLHRYMRNENGVFVLVYPIKREIGTDTLRYRIVVDGLWMTDPMNPMSEKDINGIPRSVTAVPSRLREIRDSPATLPDGRVRFLYRGPSGRNVYLVGDFNDWDPFMHKMKELQENGTYEIVLRLLPGDHYYYFLSDGLRVLDPLNPRQAADYEGFEVSRYTVSVPEPE